MLKPIKETGNGESEKLWRLILCGGIALLLAASLDPDFKDFVKANSNRILSFFVVLAALSMLTGLQHSVVFHRGLTVNLTVDIGYFMGVCGLYLIYRSCKLPKKKQWLTLFMGFMLVLMSWYFLRCEFTKRKE